MRVAILKPEVDRELSSSYGVQLGLLQEIFKSEVIKPRLFEAVMVNSSTLQSLIGPVKLSSDRPYPIDLFASLKENLDCQAVLFSELTSLRTMPPMSVGWHMKLVDMVFTDHREINEIFDGGNEAFATYFNTEAEIGQDFASLIQN